MKIKAFAKRGKRRIIRRPLTKARLGDIPTWASRALQGLVYWLGYQDAYGIGERISEGAIATEFLRLMYAHRDEGRVLEAEVLYRHIPELALNDEIQHSNVRADLVIATHRREARNQSYPEGSVEALVEVKHNRSLIGKVWEDIDFLGRQRDFSEERLRGFLIYASVRQRPQHPPFTHNSGAAPTKRTAKSPNGTQYKVRRVCRATSRIPAKNKKASGHYAILVEVG